MPRPSSDVAFSPSVKAVQSRLGSRAAYAKVEARGGFRVEIDDMLVEFLARQRSFFFATANAAGQPYIQHRGGPPGFLAVIDQRTLAFADYKGNRQYISIGNLAENAKVHLFLIDFAERERIKIWGTARVVEDPTQIAALPLSDAARAERAIVIDVEAWDINCPQHIPQRFEADDVAHLLAGRDRRIAELERLLAESKAGQ